MKKSSLAVAALLTTLSAAVIVPVAYASDTASTQVSTCAPSCGGNSDAAPTTCAGTDMCAGKAASKCAGKAESKCAGKCAGKSVGEEAGTMCSGS